MKLIDAEKLPNDKFFEGLTDIEKAKVIQWLIQAPEITDVVSVQEYKRLENKINRLKKYDQQRDEMLHADLTYKAKLERTIDIFTAMDKLMKEHSEGFIDDRTLADEYKKLKERFKFIGSIRNW